MPILLKEDYEYSLPKMYSVIQHFTDETLENTAKTLNDELEKPQIKSLVRPGMKVAVAVGSRGIKDIYLIVKDTVSMLQRLGAQPFIVSAMGSHGGGTMGGQREVLAGYGITEENLGIPVITSVDTVELGKLPNGRTIYFDKTAYEADLIIPINRIKLHTDFVGDLQSGLCKMLVIGLGNHKGCSSMHEVDPAYFAENLEAAAKVILQKAPVGFGIAVMENAYDKTCFLEAIPATNLIAREKELVKKCVGLMPYINVKEADIIIVQEIGKEISGAGYDPNVLGRSCVLTKFVLPVPKFQKMVLLDVTEASHGNAIGLGQFDVITRNVFEKMDYEKTYANAIACKCLDDARIPIMAKDEDEAVRIALKGCRGIDYQHLKIVKIKNTLALEEIQVSEEIYHSFRNKNHLPI